MGAADGIVLITGGRSVMRATVVNWETKVGALKRESLQCHYAPLTKNFKNIIKQVWHIRVLYDIIISI